MKSIRCQNCGQMLRSRRERHTYVDCRKRIEYLNGLEEKVRAFMQAKDEAERFEAQHALHVYLDMEAVQEECVTLSRKRLRDG